MDDRGEGTAFAVGLSADRVVVPPECACCGALASRVVLEKRFGSKLSALIPYCADCHVHLSRAKTRALAVTLSSALLALTCAGGLPFVWQPPSRFVYALVAAAVAALPIAVLGRMRMRPASGHTASSVAAYFASDGSLICTSRDWAERLSSASGAETAKTDRQHPVAPGWAVIFPAAAAVSALFLYGVHFPEVRIVDVTPTRLTVAVDGRPRAAVSPTFAESAAAGVTIRLPAGRHVLTASDPTGRVVDASTVVIEPSSQHLYAPGSESVCFWVEGTRYGRERARSPAPELLSRSQTFWVLSRDIDVWFAPSPLPGGDQHSTGGLSYALRQAPCEQAPGVRSN